MLKGTNSNGCATAGISTRKFNAAVCGRIKPSSVTFFVLKVEQIKSQWAQLWDVTKPWAEPETISHHTRDGLPKAY
jgi:hypothetical protein